MIQQVLKFAFISSIILFLALGVSNSLIGQKPNYKFKSIKAFDGLINSTVQATFQDSYGFVWFGTHHGLQRYDGKTFTNFVSNKNDPNGLSHNYINDFCEDNLGNIWIATGMGLNRYIREMDQIEKYIWAGQVAEKYHDMGFSKLLMDKTEPSILWLFSMSEGLIKVDITTDSVTVYPMPDQHNAWVSELLPHPSIEGKILVGGLNMYVFDIATGHFDLLITLQQDKNNWNNRVNDFVIDPADNNILWIATGDIWGRGIYGGVIRFNMETGETKYFSDKTRPGEIPDIHILQLCFYENNELWIGTRNFGVLLHELDQDRFYNYQYNEYDNGSFVTENAVRSMLLDRSGTMWFGTWGDGISILSPALQRFAHYKHLPGVKNGLPGNWITGISEDKQGHIWIGTKAGGLTKFNPNDISFEHHFTEFTETNDDPIEITFVFNDSRNNLWIGTYGNALYRYDHVNGIKRHFPEGDGPRSVSQKRISAIAELTPGEILISTYGGGLNIYRYDLDTFKQFRYDPNDSTTIPDSQVWHPILGDDGNYYFGGNSGAGLICFNPKTETFSEPISRLEFNTFLISVKNSQGRLFIAALSHGLSELVMEDPIIFSTLSDDAGNPIVGIESALVDKNDQFWLGTSMGLLKYDLETRKLIRYDPDDGLQGYDFYRFAAFHSSTGMMYFGGLNGMNLFNPEDIALSNYKPPVVLTEFKVFQEQLKIGPDSQLKQNILLTEKIELAYSQNDFSISFSGLDYNNPHKIQYKYKLVNHDDEWIQAGNFSAAGYTNMDPGKYTFQVMSTNADGVWNDNIKSLEIIIHPPWWQTTFAYIIYGLIFIIGVILVDRFQRRRLKEKARAQAREKELEQAKEIEKAYNELKTTQQQLVHAEKMASLGELTAGIAHEIQNPLNFVNNFSEVNSELIDELTEEINNGRIDEVLSIVKDIRGNEEKIIHHGKRADAIVKNMLQHSRSGGEEKESTDINALADEYLRLSYHGLRAKDKTFNADFKAILEKNLPKVNVVPQDIGRVFLNLMNNAFYAVAEKSKNSDKAYKPVVSVTTQKGQEQVIIKIKDNGNGIPEEIKDKIFQPFFTTKSTGEGTGLGLSLSYDIVKAHGGTIEVISNAQTGTEFIISLVLKS